MDSFWLVKRDSSDTFAAISSSKFAIFAVSAANFISPSRMMHEAAVVLSQSRMNPTSNLMDCNSLSTPFHSRILCKLKLLRGVRSMSSKTATKDWHITFLTTLPNVHLDIKSGYFDNIFSSKGRPSMGTSNRWSFTVVLESA